jgi:hypothetical protein
MRSAATRRRWRHSPSRPGDKGAGAEGAIDDTDEELLRPLMTGEQEEPALLHTVVREELWPPVAEVALPLAVILDLDVVRRLAGAALLQDGMRNLPAFHPLHELGGQAKVVAAPGQYRSDKGGIPIDGDVRWWLTRWRESRTEP